MAMVGMDREVRRQRRALTLVCAVALILPLSACGGGSGGTATGSGGGDEASVAADASSPSDEETSASDEESGDFVVIPGTGRYGVGTDVPFGGYQLSGEPDEQPDGCTWSIEDDDGVVAFENQGSYVFLTDIKEGTVFVTNGCPDWEQFE